ncbi:MAG: 23S rRNA (adenine(2503)-C(2))-methyltransferase RlmN [Sulfobacillus thermosulfidooxidans]|uniref:Probable dual-specificity RNA methyltransferase RlmN n=1 Tax=Sulfobacillus thermosulfidooxidans TaxID=28034 RepID=A0A2T2X648_SULTH|nr:MAG: 23S rRNA (adenine(2503)-C(2))-methyltransferase RlmN [Sulfobacillus thermosulfidooxidans]
MKNQVWDVLSQSKDEMTVWMKAQGLPGYRGTQLFEALWRHRVKDYEEITSWPKALRENMAKQFPLYRLQAETVQRGHDGTLKILGRLYDGQHIETVVLPHDYGYSVCVSSQVGCNMGCKFCASGLLKRTRNLSAGEILDQVRLANDLIADQGAVISRVDLMGIGEPLDNYENVMQFIQIAHDPLGFNLSYRHFTISTSGLVPDIYRLAQEGMPITLAVSLHAPTDDLRRQLMPINKAYPVHQLIEACKDYFHKTGRRVSFEYALLAGINDSNQHAEQLANLLKGFSCHINLIPWNPVPEHPFQPSSKKRVEEFQRIVQDRGISCTIRKEMGQEIEAACGQLRRREEELLSP